MSQQESRPVHTDGTRERDARALAAMVERIKAFPSYGLLGWEPIEIDQAEGRVRGRFNATPEFTHAGGMVSGGFIAAMLDTALSAALGSREDDRLHVTTSITVNFIGAAPPGVIHAHAHVVRSGRVVAFTEGDLRTADGQLIATATATARFLEAQPPA